MLSNNPGVLAASAISQTIVAFADADQDSDHSRALYKTVVTLLQNNAKLTIQTGRSALAVAVMNNAPKIVALLLPFENAGEKHFSRPDQTLMTTAASGGMETIVRLLHDRGELVTAETMVAFVSENHTDSSCFECLIELGGDIDAVGGKFHQCLLTIAVYRDDSLLVDKLLERGANVNVTYTPLSKKIPELEQEMNFKIGMTPMQMACWTVDEGYIQKLLKNGAPNTLDKRTMGRFKMTHLMYLLKTSMDVDRTAAMNVLFADGETVLNDYDSFGESVLHYACFDADVNAVRMLLNHPLADTEFILKRNNWNKLAHECIDVDIYPHERLQIQVMTGEALVRINQQ